MKKLFRFIGCIFKGLWKSISFIRVALLNLLFLFVVFVIWQAFSETQPSLDVKAKPSALVLNLTGPIVEKSQTLNSMDSVINQLTTDEPKKESVLFEIVETIRHAQNDPNIEGLVLELKNMNETNLTKLRYIGKALNEFKTSGKPIYASGDFYNQSQYYLASYANKIFLAPDGAVLIKGYSSYSLYYKTLLEKLEVNSHIFRVGTYKSAIEPLIRDDMSPEAKESASQWLTQLWGAYVKDVSSNRQIYPDVLNPTMDTFLAKLKEAQGDLAALSLKLGLIDELATRQQVQKFYATAFGKSTEPQGYQAINYEQYRSLLSSITTQSQADDIAIVVVNGVIIDGQSVRNNVGGDSVAALLQQARKDKKIKAVVLRVDSPGGSAFASEVIRNEIQALQDIGKPVVVSMSSLAASGGYWISMNANSIIAQPTTLTGSIGIFSVITTFEKGLNHIGVYADGVGTSPFSDVGIASGLSNGAAEAMQMGIDHGYQRFISLVANKRKMTIKNVDKIAQGRVWTGKDALNNGLIDKLGDFDDAIDEAAQLAKLKNYNINWLVKPLTAKEQFIQDFLTQTQLFLDIDPTSLSILKPLFGDHQLPNHITPLAQQLVSDAKLLNSFNDPKGQYAFCLNCQIE